MSRISIGPTAFRTGAQTITPSDTDDLVSPAVGLYVGGAGNVTGVMESGDVVTFTAVPVGTTLPFVFKRINATLTTATLMIGGK